MKHARLYVWMYVCLLLSCSSPTDSFDPRGGRAGEMLSLVKQGMLGEDVLWLLGQPSEVRTNRAPRMFDN